MTNIFDKLKKDSPRSSTDFHIPDVFVTPPQDDDNEYDADISGPYIEHRTSVASDSSIVFTQPQQQHDEFQVRVDMIRQESRYKSFDDLPSDDEEDSGECLVDLLQQAPLPVSDTSTADRGVSPRSSRIGLRIDTSIEEDQNSVSSRANVLTSSTSSSFSPETPTHSLPHIPESRSKMSLNSIGGKKKSLRKRISTRFRSNSTQNDYNVSTISTPSPKLPPIAHIHHKDNKNNPDLIIDQVKIRAAQLQSLGFDKKVFDSDAIIHALGHGDNHTKDEIVGIAT
ncbi:hypothetical protein E3P78_01755 [Wallemia ichthyophaga]|nr:hypothetical protein E3P78_01755 [Wallemia ichthyophaga]